MTNDLKVGLLFIFSAFVMVKILMYICIRRRRNKKQGMQPSEVYVNRQANGLRSLENSQNHSTEIVVEHRPITHVRELFDNIRYGQPNTPSGYPQPPIHDSDRSTDYPQPLIDDAPPAYDAFMRQVDSLVEIGIQNGISTRQPNADIARGQANEQQNYEHQHALDLPPTYDAVIQNDSMNQNGIQDGSSAPQPNDCMAEGGHTNVQQNYEHQQATDLPPCYDVVMQNDGTNQNGIQGESSALQPNGCVAEDGQTNVIPNYEHQEQATDLPHRVVLQSHDGPAVSIQTNEPQTLLTENSRDDVIRQNGGRHPSGLESSNGIVAVRLNYAQFNCYSCLRDKRSQLFHSTPFQNFAHLLSLK